MPKWAVYENKRSGVRFAAAVFFPDDAGHPHLPKYVSASKLPVEVNAVGGYHKFDPDIEEGWDGARLVEFRDYDEKGSEPLTFAERVPKNHPSFSCGWIDRNGYTYSCGSEGHMEAAYWISEALYPDDRPGGERCLEQRGWVKLSVLGGLMSEYDDGVFFTKVPSKKQIDKLLDLGRYTPQVDMNIEMARMRRTSGAGIYDAD